MESLTLYELNNLVRQTLELTMYDEFWIRAEISSLNVNRHCYMELVQKGEFGSGIVAKARAQVWMNRWVMLKPMFEHTTGQALSAGMQVMVKARVTFHELYGFSLDISDIDPTYTLGDIARKRLEILQQLKDEGVDTMNKELEMPRLLQRIAVISSASAAGYGDFCKQLADNKRGLVFKTELFQAMMQGNDVERTVIAALDRIAQRMDEWDIVVIIRGGGSTSDLSGFDALDLARNVAQFPLPIITGIGHERDDTIIDMISHTRVKTPTAAAEFLIHHQEEELDLIENLAGRITEATNTIILQEQTRMKILTSKIPGLFSQFKAKEFIRLNNVSAALANGCSQIINQQTNAVNILDKRLEIIAPVTLAKQRQILELFENKIANASPDRILKLGFSIARINGKAIKNSIELKEGDEIETTLANGKIKSIVTWKKK